MSILVNKDTKVVTQGITGATGQLHTRACREYGTQMVAGVTPGRGGTDFEGIPIFDTVEQAVHAAENTLAGPTAATSFSSVPYFWSDQYDRKIQFIGRAQPHDEMVIVDGSLAERRLTALFRRGDVPPIPTAPDGLPHTTERFVRPSKDYSWSTIVDHMCVEQAAGIWSGHYRDVDYPKPRFMWVNFTLTDSAFHEGGPHSEIAAAAIRDCDARLGEVLAAVERAGAFDDTAFLLVADHGMEENDPAVRGDWDVDLREAGLQFRDEGYSFLYLGES